jgi:hypothetical protein
MEFTKQEVDKLIKDTLNATAEAVFEWIENETNIVDKDTKEVLTNAEIDIKADKKSVLNEYIYKRLEKKCGIKFNQNK